MKVEFTKDHVKINNEIVLALRCIEKIEINKFHYSEENEKEYSLFIQTIVDEKTIIIPCDSLEESEELLELFFTNL